MNQDDIFLHYSCLVNLLCFSDVVVLMFIFELNTQSVYRRSSQQIYNVTLFFLFFMSLYGILGVQFFGALKYHCVLKGTDEK